MSKVILLFLLASCAPPKFSQLVKGQKLSCDFEVRDAVEDGGVLKGKLDVTNCKEGK